MARTRSDQTFTYDGFPSPNGTVVPDDVFDRLMPELSEAELRVLLYIVRRTFGFKKDRDAISLSQMVDGVRTRDGRVLDRGTGLSRRGVMRGCAGLAEKRIVAVEKRRSARGDNAVNSYRLRFRGDAAGYERERGVGNGVPYGGERGAPPVGNGVPPQQTGEQQTDRHRSRFEGRSQDREPGRNRPRWEVHRSGTPPPAEGTAPLNPPRYAPPGDLRKLREAAARAIGNGRAHTPIHPVRKTVPSPVGSRFSAPAHPESRGTGAEREHLGAYLGDIAARFGDEAPLSATITRVLRIFTVANVPPERWGDFIFQARAIAQERSDRIAKQATGPTGFPRQNKVPYMLACLEQMVGLRPTPQTWTRGPDDAVEEG